jgi:Spy/CpxP family protein refolding chaperone
MNGTWMKNTVLLLAMTLSGAALLAQPATPPATQPDAATQSASGTTGTAAKVQLTAEQKKQLRELRMSARDQAAIIRNDQKLTAEQKQDKLKQLRASTREQMKSVLTPAQQTALADRHAARHARVAAKLGLTAEQQSKLMDLFRSTHQQRESVLKDASLSNEQKQAQLSQIRQSSKAQLATILTPEQLAKFHEMRKAHRHRGRG